MSILLALNVTHRKASQNVILNECEESTIFEIVKILRYALNDTILIL